MKYWYKFETNKAQEGLYHYIGSSNLSSEEIAVKVQKGELVRLDELLYMERGEVKEWANWDKSLEPSVLINPTCIISIMVFKGDPRIVPSK